MKARHAHRDRGLTFVELMIAMTLFLMAIAAASALVIAGVNMASATERRGAAEDSVRLGLEAIARAAESSGVGTPGGIQAVIGGALTTLSPIFGTDGGASDPDEIWLVAADPNTFRRCQDAAGGSTTVLATSSTAITVGCATGFSAGDSVMVTNWTTGALLTNVTPAAIPPSLGSSDLSSGLLKDAPAGGFLVRDAVIRVRLLHFFVKPNPLTTRNALYMATVRLAASAPGPFVDVEEQVVQDYVEDLEVAYGVSAGGGAAAFQNGFPAAYNAAAGTLTSLRLTLVATTPVAQRDASGALRPFAQVPVENRTTPPTTPDGYERVAYTRRIELPNLFPSAL